MQRMAQGGLPVHGEHLRRSGIEVDHLLFPIDGQDTLLQRVQNILPLVELLSEGIRLIAVQGAFDAAGQLHGQQAAQHRRHHTHRQQPQGGTQPHHGHAAEVDAHNDKTDDRSLLIPHGSIGGVVRAHGAGLIKGIGVSSLQGTGLSGTRVGRADEGPVGHIEQSGLGVPHQDQVDVRCTLRGLIQIVGQLLCRTCPLQSLPEHGHP